MRIRQVTNCLLHALNCSAGVHVDLSPYNYAVCNWTAVRAFMRICQSNQGQQGTCGFFGSGGYLLYEITEGQVSWVWVLSDVALVAVFSFSQGGRTPTVAVSYDTR